MASKCPMLPFVFFLVFFVSTSCSTSNGGFPSGPEKRPHLRFFFHDAVGGPNPTTVTITNPLVNSSTLFGLSIIADNRLTETEELNSTLVGRGQGIYAGTSQEEITFLMLFNFVFLTGEFGGSTITIMGRNEILSSIREFPIIGGTGKFRMVRGYVQAETRRSDPTTNDATVEYNVYALHY